MDPEDTEGNHGSRRRFLRRSALGLSFFGLGNALGLSAPQAPAAKPAPVSPGKLGPAFDYDVRALRQVDPKLITHAQSGLIKTSAKNIHELAVATEKIFALQNDELCIYSFKGEVLNRVKLPGEGYAVTPSAQKEVYVALKDRVMVLDQAGRILQQWKPLGSRAVLTSIAVDDQNVYIADAGNRTVARYDRQGEFKAEIGKKNREKNIPGFMVPSAYFDLAIGSEGLLWVANPGLHEIEVFTPEGALEFKWGSYSTEIAGFCGCCNPVHFTLLPDGRVITSEKGIPRIKMYSARGELLSVVAAPDEFPAYTGNIKTGPIGLAVAAASDDKIFVADPLAGNIRVYAKKGSA